MEKVVLTKHNLKELADRSKHKPIVMPNMTGTYLAERLGNPSPGVDDFLSFAEKYGYTAYVDPFFRPLVEFAAERAPHLQWQEEREEDGQEIKRRRSIKTPCGDLSADTRMHKTTGLTFHGKKMIETEADLKAMAWLLRESCRLVSENRTSLLSEMKAQLKPEADKIRGRGISLIHFWTPITEVLYPFFDQENMIYVMADHPDLLRGLMDEIMVYTQFQMDLGREAGFDSMQTALWGYEQWSPTTYANFILPYVRQISAWCRERDLLFWNHTCGHMKGLLEQKMYHRFNGLDILECLNYPPAGDVDDWPRLRRFVPGDTVTKGNLEDSLILNGPIPAIKAKTKEILRQSEGFKHILGTANSILDGTPISHFEAMLEAVEEYNREG